MALSLGVPPFPGFQANPVGPAATGLFLWVAGLGAVYYAVYYAVSL